LSEALKVRRPLNGLALVNGKPKYVSAISRTDVNEGWREHRRDGGVVIDIETNEIVCSLQRGVEPTLVSPAATWTQSIDFQLNAIVTQKS
jgi:Domain of unknown function (DUF4915)